MPCPKCGAEKIGGLMQAFWVPLHDDGSVAMDYRDWAAETELSGRFMCYKCEYTWEGEHDVDSDSAVPTKSRKFKPLGTVACDLVIAGACAAGVYSQMAISRAAKKDGQRLIELRFSADAMDEIRVQFDWTAFLKVASLESGNC